MSGPMVVEVDCGTGQAVTRELVGAELAAYLNDQQGRASEAQTEAQQVADRVAKARQALAANPGLATVLDAFGLHLPGPGQQPARPGEGP